MNNVEEASASGLITGIILAVIALTLIIVIMVIYYKRRVGRLKSVNRAVMHYIQSTEGTDAGDYTNIIITKITEHVVCVIIDTSCQKKKQRKNLIAKCTTLGNKSFFLLICLHEMRCIVL